jgi:two-component system chemotaxis sensor kinase CheA
MSDELFNREEFVAYFRDEAEELLQQIDADLLKLEECVNSGDPHAEIVNSLFRALHTIKGSGGMLGFTEVQGVAHKLENLADLLRKDRMPLSETVVDLLFHGRDFLTDLVESAVTGAAPPSGLNEYLSRLDQFVGIYEETAHVIEGITGSETTFEDAAEQETKHASAGDVDAFEAEVARLLAEAEAQRTGSGAFAQIAAADVPEPPADVPEPPATPPPAAAAAPAPQPEAPAKPQKPDAKRASIHQTIRVDIERLDALLNLVGELVINRTRISDIANTLERLMADKATAGDNTMGAQHGIIAPLAKDLADSAALLARTTNEIQESIMNLLRNSVDHGIEPPDVRQQRGKQRAGTISLNAYHEGNQIIIEVTDDGGGIDLEKVRARGIRQGLISSEDRLTDRELIELIFTPGFSTAEVISDVSGRGVGMDVVKKNITRLKGIFDVDSAPGQGTRFTIKLPLTLAIIQALLVRVVDELYAIPLDSVIESQRVEMPDVRTVHGNEVITLRGQVVPLVRVADFFQLGGQRDPEKVMIVIVGLQGRQVGLVVDSFEGEQEIVIKPLSDVVGRIPGISGATILGNGSISLIIDVHSLVSEAYVGGKAARAEFSGV